MIREHSAIFCDLAKHAQYKMIDFENVKYNKKHDCRFSSAKSIHFKKLLINTEMSVNFRHEEWRDGIYYCVEMPLISHLVTTKKEKLTCFNVCLKVTVLRDDRYEEVSGVIRDDHNFSLKSGLWNEGYMLDYGREVFDFHKVQVVDLVESGRRDMGLGSIVRLYDEDFAQDGLMI